jgi:Uma2 family endonuclease
MDARVREPFDARLSPEGRRLLTHADMARLEAAGVIGPDERWELLRGEWFGMASEGYRHQSLRLRLVRLFARALSDDWVVNTEGSLLWGEATELRPDLAIQRDTGSTRVEGQDIALVAEVMVTSQARDAGLKRAIYAQMRVPELWLIDLEARRVTVLRNSDGEDFRDVREMGFEDALVPLQFAQVSVRLADLAGRQNPLSGVEADTGVEFRHGCTRAGAF